MFTHFLCLSNLIHISHLLDFIYSINLSITKSMSRHDPPFYSYQLKRLVSQLDKQSTTVNLKNKKQVEEDRNNHRSAAQIRQSYRYRKAELYNNKTKQGSLFEKKTPQIPYLFIPKYKNETFIMPNRVFEKGSAGKRFHIKMKDTSIYSFKDSEKQEVNSVLRRSNKNQVITSRKMEEYSRIINENDGRQRAERATQNIKTRNIFNPTRITSDQFSMADPLLEPKQDETFQMKKVTLNKTFEPNLWKAVSRYEDFSKTKQNWGGKTATLKRAATYRM